MARPLRIEFAGVLYHITARGDRREDIFEDNHYHLLIQTPDGNLSKGMRQLNGVYMQASNWRHRRVGCAAGAGGFWVLAN